MATVLLCKAAQWLPNYFWFSTVYLSPHSLHSCSSQNLRFVVREHTKTDILQSYESNTVLYSLVLVHSRLPDNETVSLFTVQAESKQLWWMLSLCCLDTSRISRGTHLPEAEKSHISSVPGFSWALHRNCHTGLEQWSIRSDMLLPTATHIDISGDGIKTLIRGNYPATPIGKLLTNPKQLADGLRLEEWRSISYIFVSAN